MIAFPTATRFALTKSFVMPVKAKAKTQTVFVCAGTEGGEVFHVESDTLNAKQVLPQLIEASLRWAKQEGAGGVLRPGHADPGAVGRPTASSASSSSSAAGAAQAQHLKGLSFLQQLAAADVTLLQEPRATDVDLLKSLSKEERDYFHLLEPAAQRVICDGLQGLRSQQAHGVPLRFRVLRSELPQELKRRICLRLERQQDAMGGGDQVKYNTWVEGLLALPLLAYVVPQPMPTSDLAAALKNAGAFLDSIIFGHKAAKQAMLERFYLWMKQPFVPQRPLALQGCPGNGKTSLVREGLAAIMNRPFNFVALGGSFDSSFLLGHGYTYEGSTPGRLAEALTASACMNPIFFFDELDKCSSTAKGEEVVNVLVHITDTTQSSHFRDRYFNGLDLDLSKSLMVFAFNDASKVAGVLLDRFQVVQTDVFEPTSQAKILQDHLLPRVLAERGLPRHFLELSPEVLREAASCCGSGGVRSVRSALEQVVSKACMLQDVGDAALAYPLGAADLVQLSADRFQLRGGLARLLEEGRKGAEAAAPFGMYV